MIRANERQDSVLVIGVLGAIGSGKSAVASILERRGAARIDCDDIVHELYRDPAVADIVASEFGDGVRGKDGISRPALANLSLASKENIQKLMRMIHPLVVNEVGKRLASLESDGKKLAVIEAAFLIESGLAKLCDTIWFVDADAKDCESRLARDRGWPAGEAARREAYQMTPPEKRASSDAVVLNRSTPAVLETEVDRLLELEMEKTSNPTD